MQSLDRPKPIEPEPYVSASTKRLIRQTITSPFLISTVLVLGFYNYIGYQIAKSCIEKGNTPAECEQQIEKEWRAGSKPNQIAADLLLIGTKTGRNIAYKLNYNESSSP